MALFDPFYGVYGFGKDLSRWLNRILLIAELAAIAYGYYYHLREIWMGNIILLSIAYFPLCLLAMSLLNKLIRGFWNVVEVIVYGTTDADDIIEHHERREEKRALRAQRRELCRQQAAAKRFLKEISKHPELYADKQQMFLPDSGVKKLPEPEEHDAKWMDNF